MSKFAVIIPAAGESSRFRGFRRKKPFVELKGRAIWLRTVDHFINRDDVSEVVLVLAKDDLEEFRERFQPNLTFMNIHIAEGGATRADSVQNGIAALTKPADYIAVHDAARPLLTKAWISELFETAMRKQAVIPAVAVSSTVKKVDDSGRIQQTIDRTHLMLAQTPQVFRTEILKNAYQQAETASGFTDEASLVEATGQPVFVHEGWPANIKITTKQDFDLAEALLASLPTDAGLPGLHPFSEDRFS
ncbi:2-C-methyl-D-erythritol 4-phosphate cytidylyltransferase [Fuerstiella marisgermanici]|uniref:2-C-methyl-D-erythritol 4-phosphate cytidylyltransferase n=1 Tax=Fuerstiella marisgermanici TaxID=1891926 RepID=A0A1P8WFJ1_9PLAN|nr:2-C-methyl-D-erythritol 4-phosphate cytidylyltransferase [Fuerstiella marisgermanici]APZ92816.1 2-C-methyl-D-erythritol 4-phosphate cytidylyltransferase [Fuerstiella marisgermanici]